MSLWEHIKSFFTGRVSDDEFEKEIATGEYLQCPLCQMYVHREILSDNGNKCPKCKTKIE